MSNQDVVQPMHWSDSISKYHFAGTHRRSAIRERNALAVCYFLSSLQPVRFPVKMTSPPTAILYIAEDFEYMTQLKDTLHVKEVEIGIGHVTPAASRTLPYLLLFSFSSSAWARCPGTPSTWTQIRRFAAPLLARTGVSHRGVSLVPLEDHSQRNGFLQTHTTPVHKGASAMNISLLSFGCSAFVTTSASFPVVFFFITMFVSQITV